MNASGTAPLLDFVELRLSIYDPSGTCLLYEELQANVNVTQTNGLFSVQVGSPLGSTRRTNKDPGLSMKNVFSNQASPGHSVRPTCPSGYTPSSGDSRKLRVTVTPDLTGIPSTLIPDLVIGSQASATVAQSLQGLEPQDLIRSASGIAAQGNVSLSTLSVLTSFEDASALHHHDSLYIKKGASIDLNSGSTSFTVGSLGVGTSVPTAAISLGGAGDRSIEVQRNSTINSSGSWLTLTAGGASSGSTNQAGGNLILSSGMATGNAGSQIEFKTAQGISSGSSDQPSITKMVLTALGKLGLGSLAPQAQLEVIASSPSVTAQVIQGSTSQSARLLEFQNSVGNALSYFDASGYLTLPGPPSQATQAATKNYVDSQIATSLGSLSAVTSFNARTGSVNLLSSDVTGALSYTPVRKNGDTLTGDLILNADPTESLGAVTRQYVLTALASKQDSGIYLTALSGDVTASGPGSVSATVNSVGGVSSAQLASAATSVQGATSSNTADTLVKRDPAGNFSAATITAQFNGNLTGRASLNVLKSGDTLTGLLVLSGHPQESLGAATKAYVDQAVSTKQDLLGFTPVNRAGDTLSGSLNLSGNSTLKLGIYTDTEESTLSSTLQPLDVSKTWYNSSSHTIKYWSGTQVKTLGISGAGLQSFNGISESTQSLGMGTLGSAPNWNSSGTTHTLNLPYANQSGVTAGLLSNFDYVRFDAKQSALGYTPVNRAGDTLTGALVLPSDGLMVGASNLVVSGGKVGIGLSNPTDALSINGNLVVPYRTWDTGNALALPNHTGGSGDVTTLFWDGRRGAFFAGEVDSLSLTPSNLGYASASFGYDSRASGYSSFVSGDTNLSSGDDSFVGGGDNNTASGHNSFIGGGEYNESSSNESFIGGGDNNTASAFDSFVGGGSYNTAMGADSFVGSGTSNTASGSKSFVGGGDFNTASGASSVATGGSMNYSLGENSFSTGISSESRSYLQFTIGRYNASLGSESPTSWVTTDPLFVVGNGSSSASRSNALVILKNGRVGIGTNSPQVKLQVIGTISATNFSGNISGNASTATSATTATHLAAGTQGSIPYQTLSGTTSMLPIGTQGQTLLVSSGTPSWGTLSLSGEVTGGLTSTTVSGEAVMQKQLVTFSSSPGVISVSDTIRSAFEKLDGNVALRVAKSGDTMNGALFLPANGLSVGSNQLVLSNNQVGIGTNQPVNALDVSGTITASGNLGIGTNSPSARLEIVGSDSQLKVSNGTETLLNVSSTSGPGRLLGSSTTLLASVPMNGNAKICAVSVTLSAGQSVLLIGHLKLSNNGVNSPDGSDTAAWIARNGSIVSPYPSSMTHKWGATHSLTVVDSPGAGTFEYSVYGAETPNRIAPGTQNCSIRVTSLN